MLSFPRKLPKKFLAETRWRRLKSRYEIEIFEEDQECGFESVEAGIQGKHTSYRERWKQKKKILAQPSEPRPLVPEDEFTSIDADPPFEQTRIRRGSPEDARGADPLERDAEPPATRRSVDYESDMALSEGRPLDMGDLAEQSCGLGLFENPSSSSEMRKVDDEPLSCNDQLPADAAPPSNARLADWFTMIQDWIKDFKIDELKPNPTQQQIKNRKEQLKPLLG
jgi:hypothetical protein